MEPLFLQPAFQNKIWGGRKLETIFDYEIPEGKVGECWGISAHPHGVSYVKNGQFKGKDLKTLWEEQPQLFNNKNQEVFPLLIKILDAEDELSVQVHPDDEYGKTHAGELGKTECWYVIDAEPGAEIVYGHNAKTKEEFIEMIKDKKWNQLLRHVPVKKGDFYHVPSGTIHAIGKGIMILETQQSSDTTYRVYDFDRKDDEGNLRPLHIQESIDVTNIPHHDPQLQIKEENFGGSSVTTFVETPFFDVYEWTVKGQLNLKATGPYTLATVLDGECDLEILDQNGLAQHSYRIAKGEHFILPYGITNWRLTGEAHLIASIPGKNVQ